MNVRLETDGPIDTVTVTVEGSPSARLTSSGSWSSTSNVSSAESPSMLIGSVEMDVSSASTSGSPTIVTDAGSTPIDSSAKPGAGAPAWMLGRTETVVSVSTARTSIWTETTSGSISTWPAPTGCPATSTSVSVTGSLTLIPDAGMSTK